MINRVILVSDSFIEDFVGGAALNDEVLCEEFKKLDIEVIKKRTKELDENFIFSNKDNLFIVSNFFFMPNVVKTVFQSELNYIIIEHDYKFEKNRNPATHENFLVPKDELVNVEFYEAAQQIICQSSFHKEIFDKNLDMGEKTYSLSGNLWSRDQFDLIRILGKRKKRERVSILDSPYPQKGLHKSIEICLNNQWMYDIIKDEDYIEFLVKLSRNKLFAFISLTPETLCRTILEAKMLNMQVVMNEDMIGAAKEPWFNQNGEELIKTLENKRKEIVEFILSFIKKK